MLEVLLVSVAAVAGVLAGADRLLAAGAARAASRRMALRLGEAAAPHLRVHGWPFVTQAAAGRYREIEVTAISVTAGGIELRGLHGRLTGVRAPLRPLLAGAGLVAGELTATAAIPLTQIADRLPPGLMLRRQGGELQVSGMVLLMPVTGTLALRPDGQRIAVVPKVLGLPSLVGFVIPLRGLPTGLAIDSLRLGERGVELTLRGENVRIGAD